MSVRPDILEGTGHVGAVPPPVADAPPVESRPCWSLPPAAAGGAENVAFSRDGALLAVVDVHDSRVLVHARSGAAEYSSEPVFVLEGEGSGLDYPHDVDFTWDGRWLVVASRRSRSVTGYRRLEGPGVRFSPKPSWALRGRKSAIGYCDAVAAAPADGAILAAASLAENRVSIFRRGLLRRGFRRRPTCVLEGTPSGLVHPDGLAFSADGEFLAVTNHGAGTVVVFARTGRGRYGPVPVAVVGDRSRYRCPHSVAFSRDGRWLAVSDAGSRVLSLHRREPDGPGGLRWSDEPVAALDAAPPGSEVSEQEGGAKGVAFGPSLLAFCSPQMGVRLHRLAGQILP